MIKGVNKQIVEINYTQNDYIEKAILIINPSKSAVPKDIISKKANEYMKSITTQETNPVLKAKKLKKTKRRYYFWIAALLVLTVAVFFLFFL